MISRWEFLAECLPKAIQEADMVLGTKTPIECSVDGDATVLRKFVLLGAKNAPARLLAILACNESAKTNELYSVYPECDGTEVDVRLTAIHEWAAGYEATLEGTVLGDARREVALFYKLTVAIARDDDDIRIPLVAKKTLFSLIPKKSDPIRGRIWVQGYLADGDMT